MPKVLDSSRFLLFILSFLALLVSSYGSSAHAAIVTVAPDGSGDHATIQDAVNQARQGDVIELLPGVFRGEGNREIDFLGKRIELRSRDGDPRLCSIDCESQGYAIVMSRSEGRGTAVRGITILNGLAGPVGGIYLYGASPTIENCHFYNNAAEFGAGAIRADGSALISECYFEGNRGGYGAGGVLVETGDNAEITRCTFVGNSDYGNPNAVGSAIGVQSSASATVRECVVASNTAENGAAVFVAFESSCEMLETTIADNESDLVFLIVANSTLRLSNSVVAFNSGADVRCDAQATASGNCNNLYENGADWSPCWNSGPDESGNQQLDPLFCDAEAGDYSLRSDSPCSPEYSNGCGQIGAFGVECGATPIQETSWGNLKWNFRE